MINVQKSFIEINPELRLLEQDSEEISTKKSQSSFYNFIYFCLYYSISHATVDAVLAFATAELGPEIGSLSGFCLYIFYTFSALLIAKPVLQRIGSKLCVFAGLSGLLIYVSAFFLAILIPSLSLAIFLIGACFGGVGAGLLWTGQGCYYIINANKYSKLSSNSVSKTLSDFASIFAVFYLSFETAFKFLATLIFLSMKNSHSGNTWKLVVFGIYASSAFLSVILFYLFVDDLSEATDCDDSHAPLRFQDQLNEIFIDVISVGQALFRNRRLQMMMPYQICFGFSAGLFGFYVNASLVSHYLGDGYIGMFSALTTLSAVLVSISNAKICSSFAQSGNETNPGKWIVMVGGGLCFLLSGLPLLVLPDSVLSQWSLIVLYFLVHGAARGVWESTNKSVFADYFPGDREREASFASLYFTSGLAGAIAYISYQHMSRGQLALLNTIIPVLSIACYHLSSGLSVRKLLCPPQKQREIPS